MKFTLLALLLIFHPSPVLAEQLSIGAQVDKTELAVGETLTYRITISGPVLETPKVQIDHFEGFEVVSSAQSQQIQMRGGQMRLTLVLTYFLAPTTAGNHTLGPLKIEYRDQVYETQPIEVKVIPGEGGEVAPPEERPRKVPRVKPRRPQPPRLEGGVVL